MPPRLRLVCGALLVAMLSGAGYAQQQRPGDPAEPAAGSLPDPLAPAQDPRVPAPDPQPPGQERQDRPEPQQPIFRTGISFVRVDVIVTDGRGNPISDLRQEDFEVFEDGKPQTVESFKLIEVSGVPAPGEEPPREIRSAYDEESEAARDDVRLVAIFLDDYHVRRGASMVVREPLLNFIQNQLSPRDMVGVAYPLTPVSEIQLTRNRGAIANAIQRFEGRKFDYQPRNQFEDRYAHYPTHVVEQIRNQVSLSGLKALVTHLGGLREGRKTVIVVSEGYTDLLPPQMRDMNAQLPGYGNPNRGNPNAGDNSMLEDTARFMANVELLDEMRDVFDVANRSNTSLYTLDPRGLGAFEFDINEGVGIRTDASYLRATQDTLRMLADNTDGRAIVNRNDLEAGLRQVVRDLSSYYLIGYNSTQAPADGRFHEIRVRVKRPGVQVRARKGYWALTAEDAARAVAPPRPGPPSEVTAALADIDRQSRRRAVRTWIGTERSATDGRATVTFVWEPAPPVPGVERQEPARVSLTATDGDGAPYFRGRVPDAALASAAGAAAVPAGAPAASAAAHVTFEAEPGRVQMRLSVEGARGQVLDTDVLEIVIPDFTAPAAAISTPRVLRARNAVEYRALAADATAVPVAGREFRRTDRLLIRFEAYGPGGQAQASAKILNRAGQPMSDLPVTAAATGGSQVDLPLAGLAAGEYLVEIKAAGPDGSEAKELIAFKVTS